jgi:hypothetical protein
MPIPETINRGRGLALFIMLIMGIILHGISVAGTYWPSLARVKSILTHIIERSN